MAAFEPPAAPNAPIVRPLASRGYAASAGWVAAGIAAALVQMRFALLREVLLLGALLAGYGLASALAIMLARRGNDRNMLSSIVGGLAGQIGRRSWRERGGQYV